MAKEQRVPRETGSASVLIRRSKFGNCPKEYRGRRYASTLEADWAAHLDCLVQARVIDGWRAQITVPLGPDTKTRIDFKVWGTDPKGKCVGWYQEVKGYETENFKKIRKLWVKYGPSLLQIAKRRGHGCWEIEELAGIKRYTDPG